MMDMLSNYQESDVLLVVSQELRLATRRFHPQTRPKAVLLAGQPGAGKTELSSMLLPTMENDAALINGDDYRRYHPNYRALYNEYGSDSVQMTAAFSAAVTERMIEDLSDHRFNLVIEGTGRTVDVPKGTAERLVQKGYQAEMAVIAARPEVSLISTLLRFYQMNENGTIPRATAMDAHDKVVAALPDNLDTLRTLPCFSRITIWDRNQDLLFDSTLAEEAPSQVLRNYWHRPWDENERQNAIDAITVLREKEAQYALGQGAAIDELEHRLTRAFDNE